MNKIKLRRLKKKFIQKKNLIIIITVILIFLLMGIGYAAQNSILNLNGETTIRVEQNFACESGISGSFTYNAHWPAGNGDTHYNYTLKINNDSDTTIETWEMRIKGPRDVQILTNANIVMEDDGVAVLTPYVWNNRIEVGKSLTLDVGLITYEQSLDVEYIIFNNCKVFSATGGSTTPSEPEEPIDPDVPVEPDVELTALEITPNEYEMTIGEVVPLQVTKTPTTATADLVWSSSDNSIVSVDENGIITALKEGNAIITVSANGISATSSIKVNAEDVPPVSGELDIEFTSTYNYQNQIHMKIVITNNTDKEIKSFSFDLGMPDGTTYSLWSNPGATVSGNTFDVSLYYGTIAISGTTEITGSITLPNDYNSSDYLNPIISNIVVKD